jgi:hypothetical protein
VREREDVNRTREAGNLDEIQRGVAITLNLFRNGAVGFIDWLDLPSDRLIRAVLVQLFVREGKVIKHKLLNWISESFGASDIW